MGRTKNSEGDAEDRERVRSRKKIIGERKIREDEE